ncbi:uncharacterized protein ARMOST_07588 [Armillaria ostoyae]|uniref:Oligopeptide transporter n=1 Tax=Armillaria ostoyae TaxID=47428 RepID=A0A284R683_ARMOS|nr:uncharacterized protein ARMOST_07588 [Armillaria ostoyae]
MSEQPDVHARLMSQWWYAIIFLAMFAFGVISIEVWDTKFLVQYFILTLVISFVYVIPIGTIQAVTNQNVGLNVITELIVGYALPRRPVVMMMFKTWGYITVAQALTFHLRLQAWPLHEDSPALGVQAWMFTNIETHLCDPTQKDGFICPSTELFGTASIIWGVIGPARQFTQGQVYYASVFFFLIGFACPVISYSGRMASFAMSNSRSSSVAGAIPPARAVDYVPWAMVGFIFQHVIRRHHFS